MPTPSRIQRWLMRAPQLGFGLGQLGAVVDAERVGGILGLDGEDDVPGLAEHRHDVGEVVLALGVLGAEPAQRGREQAAAEAVDRRVHLVDGELVGVGVGLLDDAVDPALLVAHDPAVPGRVGHPGGEQRSGGVGPAVLGGQPGQCLRPQERDVAGHHDEVVLEVVVEGVGGEGHADRVTGAALAVLLDELDRDITGQLLLQRLGDVLRGVPDDHHDALEGQQLERVEHVEQHGTAAERVQHLRRGRPHARALARRQHDCAHRSDLVRHLGPSLLARGCPGARGRGFEPRLGTPKDPVLPLHHPRPSCHHATRGGPGGDRPMCTRRGRPTSLQPAMGSLIKKRRKRMRKKKHKKLLKKTRWQRRQQGR